MHRPHLTPGNIPGTHFYYFLNRTQKHIGAERLYEFKTPLTPSAIEPATFPPAARCVQQQRYGVPLYVYVCIYIYIYVPHAGCTYILAVIMRVLNYLCVLPVV